jgi:hypothetical protein
MKFNPLAIIFWAILSIIGFIITGTLTGTLYWLLAGLTISFIASITGK